MNGIDSFHHALSLCTLFCHSPKHKGQVAQTTFFLLLFLVIFFFISFYFLRAENQTQGFALAGQACDYWVKSSTSKINFKLFLFCLHMYIICVLACYNVNVEVDDKLLALILPSTTHVLETEVRSLGLAADPFPLSHHIAISGMLSELSNIKRKWCLLYFLGVFPSSALWVHDCSCPNK